VIVGFVIPTGKRRKRGGARKKKGWGYLVPIRDCGFCDSNGEEEEERWREEEEKVGGYLERK
jgi:hypothetical protein